MANILVVAKIYPSDVEIDLDKLAENVKNMLPEGYSLSRYDKVPIAFGLQALRLVILMPEQTEGGTSRLEELLSNIEGVDQVEIETVHRMSEF